MQNIQQPHISLNKLGEFVYASDAKKRSILKTMKFPSTFKLARYPEPQSAFVNFMADKNHDTTIFESKKNKVFMKPNTSDWVKNNKECCLQALNNLLNCAQTILVSYLKYVSEKGLSAEEQHTNIQNVTIHIKPDVILLDTETKKIKGAIKLVFSKNREIDSSEANVISTGMKIHLEKIFGVKLKSQDCVVLDVFHKKKFTAPAYSQINKMQIKHACMEIMQLWPTISN